MKENFRVRVPGVIYSIYHGQDLDVSFISCIPEKLGLPLERPGFLGMNALDPPDPTTGCAGRRQDGGGQPEVSARESRVLFLSGLPSLRNYLSSDSVFLTSVAFW